MTPGSRPGRRAPSGEGRPRAEGQHDLVGEAVGQAAQRRRDVRVERRDRRVHGGGLARRPRAPGTAYPAPWKSRVARTAKARSPGRVPSRLRTTSRVRRCRPATPPRGPRRCGAAPPGRAARRARSTRNSPSPSRAMIARPRRCPSAARSARSSPPPPGAARSAGRSRRPRWTTSCTGTLRLTPPRSASRASRRRPTSRSRAQAGVAGAGLDRRLRLGVAERRAAAHDGPLQVDVGSDRRGRRGRSSTAAPAGPAPGSRLAAPSPSACGCSGVRRSGM